MVPPPPKTALTPAESAQTEYLVLVLRTLETRINEMSNQLARNLVEAEGNDKNFRDLESGIKDLIRAIDPIKDIPDTVRRIHRRLDEFAGDHKLYEDRLSNLEDSSEKYQEHIDDTKIDHETVESARLLWKAIMWVVGVLATFITVYQIVMPLLSK